MNGLRVGFIGLGKMGGGMAGRLVDAGFVLAVHDERRQAGAAILDKGARWAESPREVAAASDVACISLHGRAEFAPNGSPDPPQLLRRQLC